MAGTIAAPMDGHSSVGIAWRANLVTVQVAQWVATNQSNEAWIVRGIDMAREQGARIINISLGSPFYLHALADKIRFESRRKDQPQLLFANAIGSSICAAPLFPGDQVAETISVAGLRQDGRHVTSSSCKSADVGAIVGEHDDMETIGKSPDEVTTLGASSGATAEISGILALIWSAHPDWTPTQVRERLLAAGRRGLSGETRVGAVSALAAVGG